MKLVSGEQEGSVPLINSTFLHEFFFSKTFEASLSFLSSKSNSNLRCQYGLQRQCRSLDLRGSIPEQLAVDVTSVERVIIIIELAVHNDFYRVAHVRQGLILAVLKTSTEGCHVSLAFGLNAKIRKGLAPNPKGQILKQAVWKGVGRVENSY